VGMVRSTHLPCSPGRRGQRRGWVSLYKIFAHFEAFLHHSIILVFPCRTCIAHNSATLLHDHCAIYDPPRIPLAYAIRHTILELAISGKGQRMSGYDERAAGG